MQNVLSLSNSLTSVFWAKKKARSINNVALILLGVIAIAISAHIEIPLQPVPVTLQDFAVLFIGMTYGWRLGSLTLISYLFLGMIGLPVFASAATFGPSAGYLFGFLPAAALSGYLVERGWGRHIVTTALAGLAGLLVVFAGGLAVLSIFVGWEKSIELGFLPFIFGDSLKLIFLSIVIPTFWKKSSA